VQVVTTLQIFNWFSSLSLPFVMAIYTSAIALGYVTWVNIDSVNNWIKLLVVGLCYLIMVVIDYFFFLYYPMQANIFVGYADSDSNIPGR